PPPLGGGVGGGVVGGRAGEFGRACRIGPVPLVTLAPSGSIANSRQMDEIDNACAIVCGRLIRDGGEVSRRAGPRCRYRSVLSPHGAPCVPTESSV
ncbi:MAG TPA: hypothetical protein VFW75_02405, partial [Acetobacteraceae bacterium]|nr:hypothetical protein [Acetobacteraceae bacterium]